MSELLHSTAAALQKRGFKAYVCETGAQACEYVLSHVKEDVLVGIGGSMTVKELGLAKKLRTAGHEVLWHWEVPAVERPALLHRVLSEASAYLLSANALTTDGKIVEIDGTCNRVGALCYGPEQVFLLVGKNKLVEGTVAQAIARVKRETCPKNATRLGLDTPCAKTGACHTDACVKPMCCATVILEHAPGGKETHVILIDESLGF